MIRFIRFFIKGPGIALVIVGIIITIGWVIKTGQDRQRAQAEKHQTTRPLGAVNPHESVDAYQASKEVVLSDQKLVPGTQSTPEPAQIDNAPVSNPVVQQRTLPQLVSFYAQVSSPSPAPTPAPERPKEVQYWLPPSIFIPCALVNTVESSHINTPVVGVVIRDVVQKNNGVSHLIVPAGTIVSSFAHSGAVRDRIEVAGVWLFVFPDGRQLKVPGIACDREADTSNQQFGIEDGSAGLQGELVESDHWANAKAFIALLMTATMQTGTAAVNGALSTSRFGGGVELPDTTPILGKYLDQLLNGETGDGRFVRVQASKEFYIFPTDTILPTHRSIINQASTADAQAAAPAASSDPLQSAIEMERELIRQNQQQSNQPNEPKFSY